MLHTNLGEQVVGDFGGDLKRIHTIKISYWIKQYYFTYKAI